jgi:transposase
MIPDAIEVHLKRGDRATLEARVRAPTTAQRDVLRARIVLLAADGFSTRAIARQLGTMPRPVSLWRGRYAREGLSGLAERAGRGRKPVYGEETGRRILAQIDQPVPSGYARWTAPLIAEQLGDVHEQQVWRFLRASKIDLSGRKSWCESNDPDFAAKAAEIVGLYMAPPENALVICVDEKPSIQALERAQGYLKLPNGRALSGMSHDYTRNGVTTLFAAFDGATGTVVAAHENRRRRVEFLGFMNEIVAAIPTGKSMSFSTISTHTSPTTTAGSVVTQTFGSTSRRHARPRSTRWKSGSRSLKVSRCKEPPSPQSPNCATTSTPSSRNTTRPQNPSPGPKPRSASAGSKAAVSVNCETGY